MAVEDKYTDSDVAAGKRGNPSKVSGAPILCLSETFEVAAADDDGSVFRIARLSPNAVILKIEINNDAITGGTDYDLGVYKPGVGGAEIDKDLLADGLDMSAAAANGSEKNGLGAVAIDSLYKKLYELAGDTIDTRESDYDLAFTANTIGSVAGTISVRLYYIEG
jgi:hypothetical protein